MGQAKQEQLDTLISKNQALQIYLKHQVYAYIKHKLPWIETHENLIP